MTLAARDRRRLLSAGTATALLVISSMATVLTASSPASAVPAYRILITGDSITQGSSGDYTWRFRLWQKLNTTAPGATSFVGTRTDLYDTVNNVAGSQFYGDTSFTARSHAALWGTSFVDQLPNITSQMTSSTANTLVVMLGSNDIAFLTSPAQAITNLETFISRARAVNSGVDVVVGQVVTRYDFFTQTYVLTTQAADYNGRLPALASRLNTANSRVVIAPTMTGWDPQVHTYDGTHPNPTGEKLLAQRVSEALAAIGIGTVAPSIVGATTWSVPGPPVSVVPGSEQAALTWSRTSTGATGMFIEQQLVNLNSPWDPLPYAVPGNGFTSSLLAAGGTYKFRLVPAKGVMKSTVPGPATSAVVGGPTPAPVGNVRATAGGNSLFGGKTATATWPLATNATGYMMAYRDRSPSSPVWTELPYALPSSSTTFTFDAIPAGRYHDFGVRATRAFLTATRTASPAVRMHGVTSDRAYVALGDSYSSGLGSVSSNDYTGGSCLRTTSAWAYQMQPPWNANLAHLACAGATVPTLRTGQLPGLTSTFSANSGRPHLITMTIGGNDVNFSTELKSCVTGACVGSEARIAGNIDAQAAPLSSLYQDLRTANPFGDVVVGGYPGLVEVTGGSNNAVCAAIGTDERQMINRLATRLNGVIVTAANAAGVWSAAGRVQSEFAGHNACASGTDEWINSLDFDLGGASGFVGPNSFHPKAAGQLAYAVAFSDTIIFNAG